MPQDLHRSPGGKPAWRQAFERKSRGSDLEEAGNNTGTDRFPLASLLLKAQRIDRSLSKGTVLVHVVAVVNLNLLSTTTPPSAWPLKSRHTSRRMAGRVRGIIKLCGGSRFVQTLFSLPSSWRTHQCGWKPKVSEVKTPWTTQVQARSIRQKRTGFPFFSPHRHSSSSSSSAQGQANHRSDVGKSGRLISSGKGAASFCGLSLGEGVSSAWSGRCSAEPGRGFQSCH